MTIPTRILFRHMERSEALEREAQHQVAVLERFYAHMIDCHVTIEAPHRHHRMGWRYKVTVRIDVPGKTIAVSRTHDDAATHEDCYVTLRDAFKCAKRQLQDYARIRRHEVKAHGKPQKRQLQETLQGRDDSR